MQRQRTLCCFPVIMLAMSMITSANAQHAFYEYDVLRGGWVDEDAGLVWGYDIGQTRGKVNYDYISSEIVVGNYADELDIGENGFFVFTANAETDVLSLEDWLDSGNPAPMTNHFLWDDKKVTLLEGTSRGWELPGGLADNQECYVIVVDDTSIKLAATAGGEAIDLTDDGVGYGGFTFQKNYPAEANIARLYDGWRLPTLSEMEEAYAKGLFEDEELKYGPVNPDDYEEMRFDIWRWTSSTAKGGKHYLYRPSTGEIELLDTRRGSFMGMPMVVRSINGTPPPDDDGGSGGGNGNGNGGGKGKNK